MDYKNLPYTPPTGSTEYYVVKAGDTLWNIAKNYGLTVDELKDINNLASNALSIGQVLKVTKSTEQSGTTTPSTGTYYTVQKGDTLYAIANKYGLTVDELKRLNNLTSNNLSVGQQLLVSTPSTSTGETYTVKSGDTLYSIANRYGLTVDELKRLNNLTSNSLSIGQQLIVSTSSIPTNETTHTVQAGDTLYSIASQYGTTVDAIKQANNLTSNNLTIGRVLIIPTSTAYTTYTVKSGDTLYRIAMQYNTTVDKIKDVNNLTSNNLSIGQKLLIP